MRNRPLQITGMPPKNPAAAAGTGVAPLIARSVAENRNVFFKESYNHENAGDSKKRMAGVP